MSLRPVKPMFDEKLFFSQYIISFDEKNISLAKILSKI